LPQFPLLGRGIFITHAPEHAEHVLVSHQANYCKAFTYRLLAPALGDGGEGEHWARQRRLVQHSFAKRHIDALAPVMSAAAGRLCDTWEMRATREPLDVAMEMSNLTLDIVGQALFGQRCRTTPRQ
jgi:cytochrome P450